MELLLGDQKLLLLPERVVWLPENQSMVIADFHLDKAAHFRNNGLPIPDQELSFSLEILQKLISQFSPEQVVILGDLIHDKKGEEFEGLMGLSKMVHKWLLITGNHDKQLNSSMFPSNWQLKREAKWGNIHLIHGDQSLPSSGFSLSGHLHPGYKLKMEFSSHVFPAFILKENRHLVLPAFGKFTGLNVKASKISDDAFIIHSGKIYPIKPRNQH